MSAKAETRTPRTERFVDDKNKRHMAAGYDDLEHYMRGVAELADFARQLETELAALSAELEAAREDARRFKMILKYATLLYNEVWTIDMEALSEDFDKYRDKPDEADIALFIRRLDDAMKRSGA